MEIAVSKWQDCGEFQNKRVGRQHGRCISQLLPRDKSHQHRLQNNTLCCLPVTLSENGDVVSLGPQLGVSKAQHPGTGWAESLSGMQGPLPSSTGGWWNALLCSVGTEVLFSCWLSGAGCSQLPAARPSPRAAYTQRGCLPFSKSAGVSAAALISLSLSVYCGKKQFTILTISKCTAPWP